MPNNETTTKFKVDISELKKAMQEAKRSVAVANSEFKEVASTMDDWTKSSKGLQAKLDQLGSNIKSQRTILANYEKQLELTVKEYGENSKAADDLRIKIHNQQATINKTEREISKYKQSLAEVTEAEKISAKTGKSVANVLDDMSDSAADAGDGFTVLKGAIATFAGNMISGLVGSIKDGITSFMGLADETREYRTELAKLDTAFTTAGHSSKTATQTYKELYAVLGDEGQATEAVSHLAKLCSTEEELANWTNIAAGVYGTFGDSLPIEGLTEAANETAKVGKVTGPLADALNWAGVNEDKFNESLEKCSSEQERQQLITKTLNGLYSEAANKYKETNKGVMEANRANSDYTDTMAQLGEKIEPVTTTLKNGFNQLLQKILELVNGVDMSTFTNAIQTGFSILTDTVLPAITEGLQWILDNKDLVIAGLVGIAGGFAAFNVASLIMGVVKSFKAFQAANEGATVAQWLLNAAMNANPIMIIVTVLAAVVAAIVAFIATNDEARAKIVAVWNKVKKFVGDAIKAIGKFFTETLPTAIKSMLKWFEQMPGKIWTWLSNVITKVTTWANNMRTKAQTMATNFVNTVVNYIKNLPGQIWTWLTNVVSKVASWGSSLAAKGREAAQSLLNAVVKKIKEIPGKVVSIGADIVSGLWNGITDKVGWLKSKISGFVGDVKDWLKKFFKIGSPSKLMRDEIGRWLPEGIAVGIDENAKSVLSSMKSMATSALATTKDSLTGASGSLSVGRSVNSGVVNNFYQTINSPKQLSRLDIYRQSKNLLIYAGGRA